MASTSTVNRVMSNKCSESEVSKRIQAHYQALIARGFRFLNTRKKRTREEVEASIRAHMSKKGKSSGELPPLLHEINSTNASGSSEPKTPSHRHEDSSSKDSNLSVVGVLPERQLLVASEAHTSDARDLAFRNYVLQRLPMSRYDEMFRKELPSLFDSGTKHAFEVGSLFLTSLYSLFIPYTSLYPLFLLLFCHGVRRCSEKAS